MAGTVKVKVRDGWAVFDGTAQRSGGELLDVDRDVAEQWTAAGWVEPVKPPPTKRPRRT